MSLLRVYIAVSVDGYIADENGGVAWLDPYFTAEIDFNAFTATIGATVMGRKTYDQAFGSGYAGSKKQRTVVLTHRPLENAAAGVEAFAGDVSALVEDLRHELTGSGKDIWLMGGGEAIRPFHEAGLVDRWELFTIPVLLGAGVPLFPDGAPTGIDLEPTRTEAYTNGIVEVWYEPREPAAS